MPGKASIVVLSYNALEETTRPCIESIFRNTSAGSFELILVDNGSRDGTPAYLQEVARKSPGVVLCLNEENKGYAGGNNDGMRIASGDFIVLLNNDTLVPPGWLEALLRLLKEQNDIGLVGPVTNSAGNEQRIELDGLNEANFVDIAGEYTRRQQGVWFPSEKLGFFCVAMRRQIVQQIGYLDERFGIGMFEDDDYCIRARKAGYSFAVVEDCFVFHKGSVSFNKLSVETYRGLFEKNRQKFNEKHGIPWAFADISFAYWEKINRDLAELRFRGQPVDPALERILLRWENFRHLLVQIHRVEIQQGGGNETSPVPRIIARARWKIRWFNFRRNVIQGSWRERYRYVSYLADRAHSRVLGSRVTPGHHPIVAELIAKLPPSGGRKVIIFPATVDYSYMRQRPQSLADAFADAGYLVIYGTLSHRSDRVDVIQQVSDNLYLVNEHLFMHLTYAFKTEQVAYYCLWPNNRKHLEYLPVSKVIYDYMDDLSLLNLPAEQVQADHEAMLERANLITVSADRLRDKIPERFLAKTLLINNAVSSEFIRRAEVDYQMPAELATLGGAPVLGYYGAIAEWVDFELVEAILAVFPKAYLVLIGEVFPGAMERLSRIQKSQPRLLVLASRPQVELIPFLVHFDVCVIPFVKNEVTDAVSPVKLFEYLAAGKPIVTTDLHECAKYPQIRHCKDTVEFVAAIRAALEEVGSDTAGRRLLAKENTWEQRVAAIGRALMSTAS